MKALWIRVEAHEVDSVRVAQLADTLGVSAVTALGHLVALAGQVAEQTEDGHIADVPNVTLERWARWDGKRDTFARVVREILQDGRGYFDDWKDSMGKLVERRAKDRERKRQAESQQHTFPGISVETPRKDHGNSVESPRNVRGDSAATVRDGTERTTTTRPAARAGEPSFDGVMQLIRERLYVPDGQPPSNWAEGRDGSILKRLRRLYTFEDISSAVAGLALVRDNPGKYADPVDWLQPDTKVTLRALYHTRTGVLPMFNVATTAFWKHANSLIGSDEREHTPD